WSAEGSLIKARNHHSATLLPNGKVLVAGGWGGTASLNTAELYTRDLGYAETWRPVVTAPAAMLPGTALALTGTLFTGLSEASGGNGAHNSSTNYPVAMLQSQDNGQQRFLGSSATANWSSTQLTTAALSNFPFGPAWVTVFVNGIPSVAKSVVVTSLTTSSIAVTSSAGSVAFAQPVTLTATVTGNSPTGTVQFQDNGVNLGSPVALTSGVAQLTISTLTPVGAHAITADYSGDAINTSSSSAAFSQTVTQASSTTSLSALPASAVPGQAVTLTANVAVSGATPSGTVQFMDGATSLGTVSVSAGSAVLTTTALSLGAHSISAVYGGDTNVAGSSSTAAIVTVATAGGGTVGGFGSGASLANARYLHTSSLLPSGKVLVIGGVGGTGSLSNAELYDPASNSWSAALSMATARYGHTATVLPSGKVLVTGGYNGSHLTSAELYDPASNSWTTALPMATARYSHTATLLPSGKVLVTGGYNNTTGYLNNAELYDPASNSWSAAGTIAIARDFHTATLLASGKVLVTGGYNGSRLNSAELYDPASNSWSAAGVMATAREVHTSTLLPSGKVLVSGGNGNTGYLNSAELYDPAS
ncbi:MAG: Ig-like domain repeat protein, partial [Burkholderiaceae bacterium]|nr:Ig-like domain repeat protein [Burkholderiaceae bacterium]